MQKLIGTIIDVQRPVINGNTIYVFTMMQADRKHMKRRDSVYDAIFVCQPGENRGGLRPLGCDDGPSDLDFQLAFLSPNDVVEVTVDYYGTVPTAVRAGLTLRLPVIAVERIFEEESR